MQKGEHIVSMALAGTVLLTVIAIQRRWNPANLKEVASTAEDFILTTTGLRGQIPDIAGYQKVKTVRLGSFHAGLYRASTSPLIFAPGRFVIYNRENQPVFKLETLEGAKDLWTTIYDFAGRRGLPAPGSRARSDYNRDLTGDGLTEVIVGQYSGGDHCCTVVTVIQLAKDAAKVLGRIDGLDGLPFDGLELRRIGNDPQWEFIAHRAYETNCGAHEDAADVLAVYAYENGQYTDRTARYADYLAGVLRQNLAKWRQEKTRSLALLQTLAVDYAVLAKKDEAKRFFAMNLNLAPPSLKAKDTDPNTCIESLEGLLDRLPSVAP